MVIELPKEASTAGMPAANRPAALSPPTAGSLRGLASARTRPCFKKP
jgi:hypothetical protein